MPTRLNRSKLTLLQLIAATYFLVAGGPYGLEDLVAKAGYVGAAIVLLVTPFVWSLPTAIMVSELATALPQDGGYYIWVRRAMGRFWGFQEAWLSLVGSVFDIAIYPALFVQYLFRVWPTLAGHVSARNVGVAVIVACVVANLFKLRLVGFSFVLMTLAVLAPFAVLVVVAFAKVAQPVAEPAAASQFDLLGGIVVAMWNYLGWDSASTFAGEVERPQRNYFRAIFGAGLLIMLTYVLPVVAASRSGMDSTEWSTGSWVDLASNVVDPWLGVLVALGGMVSSIGMCNASILSYSRLPVALSEDGFLPAIFQRLHPRTGAPWIAILACALLWIVALQLSFERLVAFDVIFYGLGLGLQFVALVVLRIREPDLPRPFRIWGGKLGVSLLGFAPMLLIAIVIEDERNKEIGPINALLLGTMLAFLGPAVYFLKGLRQRLDR